MCLAVLQKIGAKSLTEETLTTSYNNNSDGSGIAYVDEKNKIQVRKFRELDTFVDQYQQLHKKYGETTPFMIHNRIGTHGTSDGNFNVHPFWVNEDVVFCHNGIINSVDNHKKMSDTQVFNKDYLQQLPNLWINNTATLKLIADFIGQSKLIFLSSDRTFKIVNKQLGHWVEKTWFSNSSYKSNVFDYGGSSTCSIGYGGHNRSTSWNRLNYNGYGQTSFLSPSGYKERSQYHKLEPCYSCDAITTKQKTDDNVGGEWLCTTCYKGLS